MGCDIHLVLERRVGSKWVGVTAFDGIHDRQGKYASPAVRSRNYARFAKLAGVRGDGPEPTGIPGSASDLSMMLIEKWDGDGHSHSHMSAEQFAKIALETDGNASEFAQKWPASHYLNIDEEADAPLSDWRVVFWFDN